jgi:hypothetical protein
VQKKKDQTKEFFEERFTAPKDLKRPLAKTKYTLLQRKAGAQVLVFPFGGVFVDHDQFQFTSQLTGALVSALLGLDGTPSTSLRHGYYAIVDSASLQPRGPSLIQSSTLEIHCSCS